MVNLYWKSKGQMTDVENRPFPSEVDFEHFIFPNQGVLGGDISIIHRQITPCYERVRTHRTYPLALGEIDIPGLPR
jgi:hypothetical protein